MSRVPNPVRGAILWIGLALARLELVDRERAVETTALGLWGLWLALVAQTGVPAAINYWRFRAGAWKRISRRYRPDSGY
jgi:Na+-driven multidrug efflux pump